MRQPVTDKNHWNKLVGSQEHSRLLQSWEWGEFQKSLGRGVLRLSWNNEVVAQAVRMLLPFSKHYWYIPHGPVIVKTGADGLEWSRALKEKLDDGALFIRVDPASSAPPFQRRGGISFVSATQPRCTYVLDVSQSEGELLSQMRQKTRYNIRLAKKRGVEVSQGSIEDFLRLNRETKTRDNFASHPDEYYQKMIASLPNDFINIWQATYQGEVIASSIIVAFGDTATYAHGASSSHHRDAMAPYLLHWSIIQDAKKRGIRYYDFWGANPKDPSHGAYKKSWQGISRFKAGFGGELVCYPRSFDVIFNSWLYTVYTLLRKARRMV